LLSFLALCIAALGVGFILSGVADRRFLLHGGREALDACLKNPHLDCDPRKWRVFLSVGAVLLGLGLLFFLRLGRKLRRLLRSASR
jgi:hypothetical protein